MTIPLIVSAVLFIIACVLPALELSRSHKPNEIMSGLETLAIGWTGIFVGVLPWYANPCWLGSLIFEFFQRPIAASICGIAAMMLAATTFLVIGRELPGDEGNVTKMTVIRLLPGCYVWFASILAMTATALLRARS